MIIDNASLINEVDYSSINWGPLDCYDAPYKTDKSLALYQRVVRCLTWLLYFEGKKQKKRSNNGSGSTVSNGNNCRAYLICCRFIYRRGESHFYTRPYVRECVYI